MRRFLILVVVASLTAPASANIEPIFEDAREHLGYEPWQSFYRLVKTWVPYYGGLTFHSGELYVVEKKDVVKVDPATGGEALWHGFQEPREASYISGICFHEGDFWFSGALQTAFGVEREWEEFLFRRVGDGWVYRGEYSGPLASDGENLFAARGGVVGVWRERDLEPLVDLGGAHRVTGLAWDGESLWAAAVPDYDTGAPAFILRIDAGAGEVTGWLPLPWVVYSVWTFTQRYEFTHTTLPVGLAAGPGRLFLVAEDALWEADPAAACTEGLPETVGYCAEAGAKVYGSPAGGAVGELRARDPVYRLGEEDGWWRVYTPLGVVGWVEADAVTEGTSVSIDPPD
jgi:hypothetical protein